MIKSLWDFQFNLCCCKYAAPAALFFAERLIPLREAVGGVFSGRKGLFGRFEQEMDGPRAFVRRVAGNPAGFYQGFGRFRGLPGDLPGLI
jgi:hypothetical protein